MYSLSNSGNYQSAYSTPAFNIVKGPVGYLLLNRLTNSNCVTVFVAVSNFIFVVKIKVFFCLASFVPIQVKESTADMFLLKKGHDINDTLFFQIVHKVGPKYLTHLVGQSFNKLFTSLREGKQKKIERECYLPSRTLLSFTLCLVGKKCVKVRKAFYRAKFCPIE